MSWQNRDAMPARDVTIAFIGAVFSVFIFLAQGPYQGLWQYALVGAPLVIALLAIWIRRLLVALRRARNLLALATAVRTETDSLTRIETDTGDVVIEHHVRLELVTDAERVFETRDEAYTTRGDVAAVAPEARLISTNTTTRSLRLKFVYRGLTSVDGEPHRRVAWAYLIDPPLTRTGDFVEYSFAVRVPGMEADAFRAEGGVYFWEAGHDQGPGGVALMAPPEYRIELLDAWIEEPDGRRILLESKDWPVVEASRTIKWRPEWRRGARHSIRYRVQRQGVGTMILGPRR